MTHAQLSEIEARLRECKNPHCDHGVCMGEQCWTCGGDGFMEPTQDDIAEAIRKAAADEREVARERAAQIAETHVGYHVNGVAHSIAAAIRSDGCDGCLACRARAKGGA